MRDNEIGFPKLMSGNVLKIIIISKNVTEPLFELREWSIEG